MPVLDQVHRQFPAILVPPLVIAAVFPTVDTRVKKILDIYVALSYNMG